MGSVMRQLRTGDFPPPRALSKLVSRPLEAICLKAMAFKPEDRYATATELAQDIERWLADEEVSAYQEPLTRKLARWGRRHRTVAQSVVVGLAAIVMMAAGAAVWMGALAQREAEARMAAEHARQQGLLVSAKFAARTVATEIDLRWRILQGEANDPELRTLLAKVNEKPDDHSLWTPLQDWLNARYIEHNNTTRADSWFIQTRSGLQVARTPEGDSLGKTYAHRDYFHGLGRELTPAEAADIEPIRQENLSSPYRSTSSGSLKVAFSTPIWSGRVGTPDRKVLGVLAMSVDVGEFGILQTDLHGAQTAVLIDLRQDNLEQAPHRGLLLHHPRLQKADDRVKATPLRLRPDLVQRLLDRARRQTPSDDLVPGYVDPAHPAATPLLAAFEPVRIKGRSEEVAETGWAVIVQEPAQPAK
jgi:hypothetical protein